MHTHSAVKARRTRLAAALVALVALLALPAAAAAQAKACARTATGTWTVSGVVAAGTSLGSCSANANWSRVVPLNMTAASAPTGNIGATGTIQFTRSGNHLFVGFTVAHDHDLSDNDMVDLVFDKENNQTADDGDFYLHIVVGPSTPIVSASNPSQATCQVSVTIQYYMWQSGAWVRQADAVASATVAKVAYDYDTSGDPETDLWNLEIDMPINHLVNGTNYYPLNTSGPKYFGMGAYVFLDDGHIQEGPIGNVLRWPETMPERQVTDWDLGFPAWDATTLAQVSLADACFNVTVVGPLEPDPWYINNQVQHDGDAHQNPANQDNKFRVAFYYDGPGDAAANGPNNGQVRITVTPMTASGWAAAWAPPAQAVEMTQYNMEYFADFDAPAHTFDSGMQWACSDLYLQNFTVDDNKLDSDNHIHINHNYIHTSNFTQLIDVGTTGIRGLAPGQATSVVLNFSATNESGHNATIGPVGGWRTTRPLAYALLAAGLLALLLAVVARRRRVALTSLAGAGAVVLATGCAVLAHINPYPIGNDRWQVQNAGALGLVPIEKKPGWYRMPIREGEVKTLRIQFGDTPLPYKTVVDRLPMRSAQGTPNIIRVPVRQGHIITVVAVGLVDVDGPNGPAQPVAASGFSRVPSERTSGRLTTEAAVSQRYLLSPAHNIPAQAVGALIGSFDGFRTSFVVGPTKSIVVPRGSEQLSLAINATANDYRAGTGDYEINIIDMGPPQVPTASPIAFDTPIDRPRFLVPWNVLTAMNVYTYHEAPVQSRKTNIMQTGYTELGEAHVSIYRSSAMQ